MSTRSAPPSIAERADRTRRAEDIAESLVDAVGVVDLIARAIVGAEQTGADDLLYTPEALAHAAEHAHDLAELLAATVNGRKPRGTLQVAGAAT
jgi:hypothetical protein